MISSLHMPRIVLLSICATIGPLLASCGSQVPNSSSVNNSTLSTLTPSPTPTRIATTSERLLRENPREQYWVIKDTFHGMLDDMKLELYEGPYNLDDCQEPDGLDLVTDDVLLQLTRLAFDVVRVEIILPKLGYPKSVWQPLVGSFEKRQVDLILKKEKAADSRPDRDGEAWGLSPTGQNFDDFKKELIRTLTDYRDHTDPDLREVVYFAECGAGEIQIFIKAEPADGRVMIIPVFFFNLCKAQGLDSDDPAQCDRWIRTIEGQAIEVSGDYYYRATWPVDVKDAGRFSVTTAEEGDTITFRKP